MNCLNILEERIDSEKLVKLFSYIYNPKIDVEFLDEEVEKFNYYVCNEDINSIVKMFEYKEKLCHDVLYEMIYSKMDDFDQFVIDHIYEKVDTDETKFEDFFETLTDYEKLAVLFCHFECEVIRGGLRQWASSNYSNYLDNMYTFVENSNFSYKNSLLEILYNVRNVKDSIKKLNPNDEWYDKDCKTRLNGLCDYDEKCLAIKKSWDNYFVKYLIDNITDDYIELVKNLPDIEV